MANKLTRDIDEELVRKLAQLLEETGLTEIEYGLDDWHIRVSSATRKVPYTIPAPYAVQPTVSGDASPAPKESDDVGLSNTVTSPMVGVVFTSSDPQIPPFVKIGDQVLEGQTLLLIEAMKVFNPIVALKAGKVTQILVVNGTPVEFGEPLLTIE